jgi:hypothetical protein
MPRHTGYPAGKLVRPSSRRRILALHLDSQSKPFGGDQPEEPEHPKPPACLASTLAATSGIENTPMRASAMCEMGKIEPKQAKWAGHWPILPPVACGRHGHALLEGPAVPASLARRGDLLGGIFSGGGEAGRGVSLGKLEEAWRRAWIGRFDFVLFSCVPLPRAQPRRSSLH